jgi:hypothetical protein
MGEIFKLSGALPLLAAMPFNFLIKIVDLAEGFFGNLVVFLLTQSNRIRPKAESFVTCGHISASACEQQQCHHHGEFADVFLTQLHR